MIMAIDLIYAKYQCDTITETNSNLSVMTHHHGDWVVSVIATTTLINSSCSYCNFACHYTCNVW